MIEIFLFHGIYSFYILYIFVLRVLLQIFEWWYFRKYGTSFIEQVSVSHLRPLIGGAENANSPQATFSATTGENEMSRQGLSGDFLL